MNSNIIAHRNIFINTESMNFGDGSQWRVSVPPAPFSIKSNQRIKLTLMSLEVRKNWYEVNQTNNAFFLQLHTTISSNPAEVIIPCIIPPGSYRYFAGGANNTSGQSAAAAYNSTSTYGYSTLNLVDAIKFAVDKALIIANNGGVLSDWNNNPVNSNSYPPLNIFSTTTSTVLWNAVQRQFQIQLPSLSATGTSRGTTIDFIFFQMKNDVLIGGSNIPLSIIQFNPFINNSLSTYSNWNFQDTHELVGGIPTRDNNITYGSRPYFTPGLNKDSTGLKFTSFYVGQLNTLEGIYLRIYSSATNNYSSPSLDRDAANNTSLSPTTILARIPISAATYDDVNELISYQDPGSNIFTTYLEGKFLESLNLSLTDDKSRPISEVASSQSKYGNISYKFTLKFEVEQLEFSASSAPASVDVQSTLSPVGFVSPLLGMNNFTSQNVKYTNPVKSSFNPVNGNRIGAQ